MRKSPAVIAALLLTACSKNLPYDSSEDIFLIGDVHVTSGMMNVLFYSFESDVYDENSGVFGSDFWDTVCFEDPQITYAQYEKEYIFYENLVNMFCLSQMWQQANQISDEAKDDIARCSQEYYESLGPEADEMNVSSSDIYSIFEAFYCASLEQEEIYSLDDTVISEEDARVLSLLQVSFEDETAAEEFVNNLDDGADVYSCADAAKSLESKNISRNECENDAQTETFLLHEGDHTQIYESDGEYLVCVVLDTYQEELSQNRMQKMRDESLRARLEEEVGVYKADIDIYVNSLWEEYVFGSENDWDFESIYKSLEDFYENKD